MGRAPCCDKANVKKGPWSTEEDAKLKAYIEEHGTGGNWIALPQKIGLKRCGKSCRLRWLNYLRPNIKHGDFSEEEEHIICSLYISIGSRWSIIAAQLPGRTDNDIKNYWNTKLKKKLLGKRAPSRRARANQEPYMPSHGGAANCGSNSSSSSSNTTAQALSASALERIQLHMRLQGLYSTFFSNHGSSPWPKHDTDHKLLPSQQTDAVATTVVQQPLHLGQSQCLATVAEAERVSSARASYTQQESFERSGLGFSCPVGAPVVDMPSSSSDVGGYSYTGFGLHDELYDLMYCKSGVAAAAGAPHDGIPLPELHCANGSGALTWATCDYGATLQDSSVLQDYVLGGYDA